MTGDELGLCGRCLVVLNASTSIEAHHRPGGETEHCPNPTNPRTLRLWAEEKLWGDGCMISVNDQPFAFDPVATWHGDPVCAYHLTECVRREQ